MNIKYALLLTVSAIALYHNFAVPEPRLIPSTHSKSAIVHQDVVRCGYNANRDTSHHDTRPLRNEGLCHDPW